jgi:hypothetical protein
VAVGKYSFFEQSTLGADGFCSKATLRLNVATIEN